MREDPFQVDTTEGSSTEVNSYTAENDKKHEKEKSHRNIGITYQFLFQG